MHKPELLCISFIGDIYTRKLPENSAAVSSVCDRSAFSANCGRWVTVMNEFCAFVCVWVGSVYVFVFVQQKTGCEIYEIFLLLHFTALFGLSRAELLSRLCAFQPWLRFIQLTPDGKQMQPNFISKSHRMGVIILWFITFSTLFLNIAFHRGLIKPNILRSMN